jgi:peptidoglycan/xylan/chitin deacetylase (PgdA/CDA1 family)
LTVAGLLAVGLPPAEVQASAGVRATAGAGASVTPKPKPNPKPKPYKTWTPYCKKHKCIALTFDDGPWPYTPALLDTLKKYHAKATFFLVGAKVVNRPEMVQRIHAEGHEIGNHTWSHPYLNKLSDEDVIAEISGTQTAIHDAIGIYPDFMRPPFGATNAHVGALMKDLGLAQIKWTGATQDTSLRDTKKIVKAALKLARPNAIILMHDIVPETVKGVPAILKELKKRGYTCVTITTLLGKDLTPGKVYP